MVLASIAGLKGRSRTSSKNVWIWRSTAWAGRVALARMAISDDNRMVLSKLRPCLSFQPATVPVALVAVTCAQGLEIAAIWVYIGARSADRIRAFDD